MTAVPVPFESRLSVEPAWLDPNGHMNVAFYMTAFDRGSDPFFDDCGLGWDYTRAGVGSIFATGCNVDYRHELLAGDPLRVTTQLIDLSEKMIHLYASLYHDGTGALAATQEILFMHVSLSTRRSAPIPPAAYARLQAVLEAHAALPSPAALGRKLEIRRR